tara:strand:+ start:3589 stop:4740 length:1152 start_codon:yes stop_codon:yes gene_type:complete
MEQIELPVSMGEALDKLTILDIKLEKIKDNRKHDVQKEYNILYNKLKLNVQKYDFNYKILKQVNLDIWEMQDDFRYNNGDKAKLCFKIIEDNDRRFRIKKKINNAANSSLKEQKGYKPKKAFVLTHLGLGDNITSIGAVRYLSTCYDKVLVVCKEHNKKNMELFYSDDETIQIYPVVNDEYISPRFGFSYEKFKEITKNMDLYMAGSHCLTKKSESYTDLPFNFYRDMGINDKYFREYFHINIPQESKSLFNKLNEVGNYTFIHNSASTGEVFKIEKMEKQLGFNKNNTLVVNPCINMYNKNDPFYLLAERLIKHPLSFYIDIIINANKVIMVDSSFFCMAINLPLISKEIYLKSRENRDYSYLNSKANYSSKLNKPLIKFLS